MIRRAIFAFKYTNKHTMFQLLRDLKPLKRLGNPLKGAAVIYRIEDCKHSTVLAGD